MKTRREIVDDINRAMVLLDERELEQIELLARGLSLGVRISESKENKKEEEESK